MQGIFFGFGQKSSNLAQIPQISLKSRELAGNFGFCGQLTLDPETYEQKKSHSRDSRELAGNFSFYGQLT
jgi:hypothetical protein